MSTDWGLDLDMSAVRLMRWSGHSWDEVQTEAIDSPDIETRLNAMLTQIDQGAEVTVFLPLDQILCTDVEIVEDGDTKAAIEQAMDGRTPYALDELILDWEVTAPGQAKVVAIASDTLDEAAAFAEVRGIGVSTYSSLGLGESFPRLPRFGGPHVPSATAPAEVPTPVETAPEPDVAEIAEPEAVETPVEARTAEVTEPEVVESPSEVEAAEVTEPEAVESPSEPEPVEVQAPEVAEPEPKPQPEEAMFATGRKPSRPPVDAPSKTDADITPKLKSQPSVAVAASAKPVVQVDDATPVMLVKGPALPLNPGQPLTGRIARPRVRTDIAAGAVSGRAASLSPKVTPGGSVQVHRRRNPVATTALVFAAAFLLTIGIATMVWSLLPMAPDQETLPTQAETGFIEPNGAPETETATLPEPEIVPEEDVAESIPLVPELEASDEIAALPAPVEEPLTETVTSEEDAIADVEAPVVPTEPDVPDLPQPVIFADIADAAAPSVKDAPELPTLLDTAPNTRLAQLASVEAGIAPQPSYDPVPPLAVTPDALAGVVQTAPSIGSAPEAEAQLDDIYVASIESSDLASDAIALPSIFGLQTDVLPQVDLEAPVAEAPAVAAVTPAPALTPLEEPDAGEAPDVAVLEPTPEDTPQTAFGIGEALTDAPEVAAVTPVPDDAPQSTFGIGEPLADTPDALVEDAPEVAALTPAPEETSQEDALAAAVEQALTDALAGPGGLIQTAHAAALPDTGPRARPQRFVETIERDQFGGRTRTELAGLRPPARPGSAQSVEPAAPPSNLAVARSLAPRLRPDNFGTLVTAARVQRDAEQLSASVNTRTPDTSSAVQAALEGSPQQAVRDARQPNIPSSASVARQATVDNVIRLNRVNLVGVYGAAADRRALVRLPSGRYVKVKVGDRVDGGTVAQITDRELFYRKGTRTLSLAIPQS